MENSCTSHELNVGKLARRAGATVSTPHFYGTKGLISSQHSTDSQQRSSRETLRRVVVIRVAQQASVPLAGIAHTLQALSAGRSPSTADWAHLSVRQEEGLTERIDKLLLLHDQLNNCIGCGYLSLQACSLRNPDDQLSAEGSGAR